MRVDIDKLEAHIFCCAYMLELVREVRELRGIAEAARMDHEHARKHCACVDFTTGDSVTCEMADRLARYDAGGTP